MRASHDDRANRTGWDARLNVMKPRYRWSTRWIRWELQIVDDRDPRRWPSTCPIRDRVACILSRYQRLWWPL